MCAVGRYNTNAYAQFGTIISSKQTLAVSVDAVFAKACLRLYIYFILTRFKVAVFAFSPYLEKRRRGLETL